MSPRAPFSVILIANYVPDKQESMLRFAAMLEKELAGEGIDVRTIRPHPVLLRFTARGFFSKWLGYIDKFVIFPFVLRELVRTHTSDRVLFHICDHSNAVYGSHLRGQWLLTCHDLLAVQSALGEIPKNPTRFSGRILQKWILNGLRKAPHVACDSDHTADQVTRLARIPRERQRVIRLGLNESFAPMGVEERGEILAALFESRGLNFPAHYLFHVGGNQWYKNRRGLIELFSQVASAKKEIHLVFAGQHLPQELVTLAAEKGLDQRVLSLGEISHLELNALYSGADALVFPSLVEGFGWPVVEAQASGCPVIVSDRAPLNEITGDAAIFIDPENLSQASQVILNFLENEPDKTKLIKNGLANSVYFQTDRMIRDYVEFYQNIVSEKAVETKASGPL